MILVELLVSDRMIEHVGVGQLLKLAKKAEQSKHHVGLPQKSSSICLIGDVMQGYSLQLRAT